MPRGWSTFAELKDACSQTNCTRPIYTKTELDSRKKQGIKPGDPNISDIPAETRFVVRTRKKFVNEEE